MQPSNYLLLVATALSLTALAQSPQAPSPKHVTNYLTSPELNYIALLPPPPTQDSAAQKEDIAAVHAAEAARTPVSAAAAQRDDKEESMFLYASVMGAGFTSGQLPLTAALSAHLRNEVSLVDPPLKASFARPRPFLTDTSLHPVCELSKGGSYPSGHSANGYLYAFVLAQMFPEKSQRLLARADEYAHNRVVCGVHYPTDTEASRRLALILVGTLESSAKFRDEVDHVRIEILNHASQP